MGEAIRSFRELRVYRTAFAAAVEVRSLVMRFPRSEVFELGGQALRSSRSVCANVAEAWRKRRYPKAFVSKLSDAEAEATETRCHLDFALACGFITKEEHARVDDQYDKVVAQLVLMMRDAAQWAVGRPGHPARRAQSPSRPVAQSHDGRAQRASRSPEPRRGDGSGGDG